MPQRRETQEPEGGGGEGGGLGGLEEVKEDLVVVMKMKWETVMEACGRVPYHSGRVLLGEEEAAE